MDIISIHSRRIGTSIEAMIVFPGELIDEKTGKASRVRIRALFSDKSQTPVEFKNSTSLTDEVAINVLSATKEINTALEPVHFVELAINNGLHPDFWSPLCEIFNIEPPKPPDLKSDRQVALAISIWFEPLSQLKYTIEANVDIKAFSVREFALKVARPIGAIPASIFLVSNDIIVATFMAGKDY